MTSDTKKTANSSQQHIGLESFFPLLDIDTGLRENKQQKSKQNKKSEKEGNTTTILIRRRTSNSDIWICNSCTLTGDRWFMEKHPCKQNVRNNFAKVAQRFQKHF